MGNFLNTLLGNPVVIEYKDETPMDLLLESLSAGSFINKNALLQIPAVSSNCKLISDTIASMPIKLYRRNKDGGASEVIGDERTDLLNQWTNSEFNGFELKKAMIMDFLLDKGGYAYIVRRSRSNKISKISYIPPENISCSYLSTNAIDKKVEYRITGELKREKDIIKITRNTHTGCASRTLAEELNILLVTAYEQIKFQNDLISKGGQKKGFLKSQKKLSTEAMSALRNAWARLYEQNTENCIVLNDGLEFQESSATPAELQLVENIIALNKQIDSIFQYDNDVTTWFRRAILPILIEFETSLNHTLLLESEKAQGYYFKFDTLQTLNPSAQDRADIYRKLIDLGVMSINEARKRENLESIPDFDMLTLNLGNVLYDINKKIYLVPNMATQLSSENFEAVEIKNPNPEKKGGKE